MEFNRLKYFYYVAKEGGFTKASQTLRVAQPAISKFVRELEEEFGYPLLERLGRRVRLTKEGGDVFRHCEVIFGQLSKIESLKKDTSEISSGPLKIGASDSIAAFLIPKLIPIVLKQYPKVVPTVITGTATELCTKLIRQDIELGFFFHLPDLSSELEIRQTLPVEHRLVISKAVAKSRKVRSTFIGSREVDDSASKSFPTLKRIQEDYPEACIAVSTNCISAHKSLVFSGFGVSVLPGFVVDEDIKSGKLVCLYPNETFEWSLKLVCRKDQRFSSALQYFIQTVFDGVRTIGRS